MAHVCILYAVENQPFATKLEDVLFEMGHAVSRREVDRDACAVLGAAGGEPDAMLVIWSAASIASPTVIAHARRALARRTLTPVAIGKIEPPQSFQHLWPIDLSGWAGDQEDPRWRFVTDEINLSIRRSEIGFEDLTLDAPVEAPPKKFGFSGPAVLFGGAVALAAVTLSLIAVAPLIFGRAAPEKPTVAFVTPETIAETAVADGDDAGIGEQEPLAQRAPAPPQTPAPALANLQEEPANSDQGEPVAPFEESPAVAVTSPDANNGQLDDEIAMAETAAVAEAALPTDAIPQTAEEPADISVQAVAETLSEPATAVETTSTDDDNFDPIAGGDDLGFGVDFEAPSPSLKPIIVADAASSAPPSAAAGTSSAASVVSAAATVAAPTTGETIDTDGLDRLIVENTVLQPGPEEFANVGNYFRECVNCPDMAEIPAGSFVMGTPLDERARHENELTLQEKVIPYRFAIGAREVTFDQWDACVADGGCRGHKAADYGWGRKSRPVINVSWEDAQSFVDWLSRKTGQDYRLPTEAEWEYAARAGAQTPFAFGASVSDKLANFNAQYKYGGPAGVYRQKTTPVASFKPNAFGLFDMHGNVWEWTEDCWAAGANDAQANCSERVLKGGAWNTGGWRLRAGHRIAGGQTARDFDNGFRVARTLE